MKEPEKLHQLPTPFQVNVWSLPESSLAQWIKCKYRQHESSIGLLQKCSWWAKSGHKQYLFQEHYFTFNLYKTVANSKEQGLLMDQDRGKPWLHIFCL